MLQIQSLGWNFSLFPVSVGNFKQIKAVPPPEPMAIGLPPTQWHSSHPGLFLGTLLEEEVGEVGLGWGGTRGYVCRVGWRGVGWGGVGWGSTGATGERDALKRIFMLLCSH